MKSKSVGTATTTTTTTTVVGGNNGCGVATATTVKTPCTNNNNTTTISSNSNSTKSTIHSVSDHDSSSNSCYTNGSEHSTNNSIWSNTTKKSAHHRHSHTTKIGSTTNSSSSHHDNNNNKNIEEAATTTITESTGSSSQSLLLLMELLNINPTSDAMKFDEKRFLQLITTYPEVCTKKYQFDIYNNHNHNNHNNPSRINTTTTRDNNNSSSNSIILSPTKKLASKGKHQHKKDDNTTMDDNNNNNRNSNELDLLYPLHMVCAVGGSLSVVKQVYKIFPPAVDYCSSGRNLSCLHCAAMYTRASIDVIQFLFRKMTILHSSSSSTTNSVTLPKTSSYQQTPLHLACLCPPSKTFHNPQVVMILTELGGSSVCADIDRYGRTPLHIACSVGQAGRQGQQQSSSSSLSTTVVPSLSIIQDLTEVYSKACVVQCTKYQATPLHILCSHPNIADETCTVMVDIMKDLLRTDPMATQMYDWKDEIPIQIAIQNHVTYKTCKMLIRKYPECVEMKFRYNPPLLSTTTSSSTTNSTTTKGMVNSKVVTTSSSKPQPLPLRISTTGGTNSTRLGRITETDDDTTNNDDENDDPISNTIKSSNNATTASPPMMMMMSLHEMAKLYNCSQDVIDLLNPYEDEVLVDDEELKKKKSVYNCSNDFECGL